MKTKIEWATHTSNYQAGCDKVSPACTHCYALPMSIRLANMGHADRYQDVTNGDLSAPAWNGKIAADLDALRRIFQGIRGAQKSRRVFLNSMTDTFHQDAPAEALVLLAEEIKATTGNTRVPHVLMLLTKRPGEMRSWQRTHFPDGLPAWVWAGCTVEDQRRANERIPELLEVRAVTRFLSMEPLLGPVDLRAVDASGDAIESIVDALEGFVTLNSDNTFPCGRIHWVIAGGESGNKARPSHPDWFRTLRDQCADAGVAFHFKQWGAWDAAGDRVGKHVAGRLLDGRTWDEVPR